jgi:two-component system nitrogen regulation response regulator GlnG
MGKLLLVDDEPSIQHAFRRVLRSPEFTVLTAGTASEGLELLKEQKPDVVVLDIHLPDASGLETLQRVQQIDARIPVILITGHGTTDLAIEAMKRGAFEYLLKPLELAPLRHLIDRAFTSSRLMNVPAVMVNQEPTRDEGDALIGQCPSMQEVYKAIGRVASQDVTILIRGESGTGKELVARAIYQHSRRSHRPFLGINCGAIPETLLESELFGHEKGAFTGAERKRIGKFEQVTGGTLFLDEVGDMTPLTQIKLLRVLQEKQLQRVGGNEVIPVDVRLLAATNADLEKLGANGRFRSDLYFRLNVFTIALPALRDRNADLDLLIDYYLKRYAQELEKTVHPLPDSTREVLKRYPWPGNVRELQSVLKQALLQMRGPVLLPEYFPPNVLRPAPAVPGTSEPPSWEGFIDRRMDSGSEDLYAECLAQLERQLITRVLQRTSGNQVQAARILGITRGSLRTKIRALGITIERAISADDDLAD